MKLKLGEKIGDLTIKEVVCDNIELGHTEYLCVCECGKELVIKEKSLLTGEISNCGCKKCKEFIVINCSKCNSKKTIPFDRANLKVKKKIYRDLNNKECYEFYYQIEDVCSQCKKSEINEDETTVTILKRFIEEKCVVVDKVPREHRIKRSEFREVYRNWLINHDLSIYFLTCRKLNYILKKYYDETYSKIDGIYYMSKIMFR